MREGGTYTRDPETGEVRKDAPAPAKRAAPKKPASAPETKPTVDAAGTGTKED